MSKFNGFVGPQENWSKLPHELIEELVQIKSLAELKIILYVIRHTWGYQDQDKKITNDEFMNGRKRRDQTRIDQGTGLTKKSVISGIRQAIDDGFLQVFIDDSDKARIKKSYGLVIRGVESIPQGCRKYTPGVKKVYPRGVESIPRSEKETTEKKKEKESPLSPNSPDKNYLDPVQHMVEAKETYEPDVDFQWLTYRNKALAIFDELSGEWGRTTRVRETKRGLIAGFAGELKDFNEDRWRLAITESIGRGVGGGNIQRFIEVYQAGSYDKYIAKKYPPNSGTKQERQPDEPMFRIGPPKKQTGVQ